MNPWAECRFLTCSLLPVARACDCECPFCFSRSSLNALPRERSPWEPSALHDHLLWARSRGATRAVITGGGEPLLRPELALASARAAARVFGEVALFTNGSRLTRDLALALADAGLSHLCWSRHHWDDARNRAVMGPAAPDIDVVLRAALGLRVRATCVMHRGGVETADDARGYLSALGARGVEEFTFKHTYVAHERSLYRDSEHDRWCRARRVEGDLFAGEGEVVAALPWGPVVRRIEGAQVCFYREPTPEWELTHGLCRSSNLMADGRVYASLEDSRSLLSRLGPSPTRSLPVTSRA